MCQYTRLTSSFQINWSLNCILEQRGIPRAVTVSFKLYFSVSFSRRKGRLRHTGNIRSLFVSDLTCGIPGPTALLLPPSPVRSFPSVHSFPQGAHTTTAFQSFLSGQTPFPKTFYSFQNTSIPIWTSTVCPIRLTSSTAYFLCRSIRLTFPSNPFSGPSVTVSFFPISYPPEKRTT